MRGRIHHLPITFRIKFAFFQGGTQDAHAQRLAENQHITRLRRVIALDVVRMRHPHADQTVDRLGRINGMTARDRNACRFAYRCAAGKNVAYGFQRQLAYGHAHHGQRQNRRGTHGIHVGQGIGCSDAPEVARVIHDGHEEIGGDDDRLRVVEFVHRRIVATLGTDHQVRVRWRERHCSQHFGQHRRSDLAAATAAV